MSLLAALREATTPIHDALHGHPLLAPLASDQITLPKYAAALRCFHSYYAAQEGVRSCNLEDATIPDAPVMDWLTKDFMTHEIQRPTPIERPIKIDGAEALWGYLYVKQGSTLGGQIMSKALNRHLGLIGGKDQHFFFGYGEGTGPAWKRFTESLGMNENRLNWEKTCASALESFTLLSQTADSILEST